METKKITKHLPFKLDPAAPRTILLTGEIRTADHGMAK